MAKKMTKQEYDAWRSQHTGKNQFEIFHKDGDKTVVDFTFWAATREAAIDELELFKQKQQLVAPSAETEYFYREINNYAVAHKDGTYTVGCGLMDMMDFVREKESWREKVKDFFMSISWKMCDIKYMLYDVIFWFGHYDMKTNHGEERADCWSIGGMITRKLLFNIPRMIKSLHGCPSKYAAEAVVKARTEKGQRITLEQAYKINASTEEMDMAMSMWKADLEKLVLYIRLYEYYNARGIVGKEDGPEMEKIDKEYRNTLPVMPGTDNEIDYLKCEELTQKYWELYCDHWKTIGRMCWN